MNKAAVQGGSIDDGDLILVRQQPVAKTGDIIVGMVDGEATVKRLVTAPGYLILKPESKDKTHRQIVVGGDFRVAGKVTHVLKKGSGLRHNRRSHHPSIRPTGGRHHGRGRAG